MRTFHPIKEILPPEQHAIWSDLAPLRQWGFVLYGGTAIALRLGHRQSIDFDFFTAQDLDKEAIRNSVRFMEASSVIQEEINTFSVLSPGGVKVSFFGGLEIGRFGTPEWTDDSVLSVASIDDLMSTKLKAMLQRVEAKDYIDIAAMIRSGASLGRGLAIAEKMFAPSFAVGPALKALIHFEGGDLGGLSRDVREVLVESASHVTDLPEVAKISPGLHG